jgi:hypothetical protein
MKLKCPDLVSLWNPVLLKNGLKNREKRLKKVNHFLKFLPKR